MDKLMRKENVHKRSKRLPKDEILRERKILL